MTDAENSDSEPPLNHSSSEPKTVSPSPTKQETSEWSWTTCLVVVVIYTAVMRQMNSAQTARNVLTHQRQSAQSNQTAQEKVRRQQACLAYWQAAVADLHAIRFETPSGDEPSGIYRDRITDQLWKLTERAKGASKANEGTGG